MPFYTGKEICLDENYAYADYKMRVYDCNHFILSILEYCYNHKDEMSELVAEVDQNTIQRGLNSLEKDSFAVEFDISPLKRSVTIRDREIEVIPRESGWTWFKKRKEKRLRSSN